MLLIDIIDFKTKRANAVYLFVLQMINKSITKDNMTIFEDLSIN